MPSIQSSAKGESSLSASAARVQDALAEQGFDFEVIELPDSTRTAAEAAVAVKTTVGQIAKSLILKGLRTGQPVLVIASGTNRLDPEVIAPIIGEPVELADADYVRERAGYAIGGVPPIAHREPIRTLVDADLLQYERIWAAAGTPRAVFSLTPEALVEMTRGKVVKVN